MSFSPVFFGVKEQIVCLFWGVNAVPHPLFLYLVTLRAILFYNPQKTSLAGLL